MGTQAPEAAQRGAQDGSNAVAELLDDYPAVRDGQWLYLVIPRSMHAIRVPADQEAAAPWRQVLADYPSLRDTRLYRRQPDPWGVTLVVGHRCNLSCVYCFSEVGHSTASLEADRMLAIVDHTLERRPGPQNKLFGVNFFGGEPTLAISDIEKVVEHTERACAAKNVTPYFTMVTNGTAPLAVLQYLVDHRFTLTVSMDAAPKRQGEQRIYGKRHNVGQTMDTIRFLAEAGVPYRVRSTVTGETVHHMGETVGFFADLGANFVHFEPVGPVGTTTPGRLSRYSEPSAEDYAENLLRAMDVARGIDASVFSYAFQHLLSSPPRSYCGPMSSGDSYHVLNATGELIMCPEMQDPARNKQYGHNVGQATDRNVVFVDLLRKDQIGQAALPSQHQSCQTCYARDICDSGCPSRNIQATGSLTKLDRYSCAVAKRVCADVLRRLAVETFRSVEPTAEPLVKPISLPRELCSVPLVGSAIGILQRARVVFALTGERLDPAVDTEIARLTRLGATL
ncbi:radical SAM/SPASM domain-containing protein [Streptomyces sp. NBC_00448]|uniref:radical SAM/SPASM domain-containing protein n=1 Tax=Streptomyces sp. NBC_00448 TaxID=2903652 RepID=UPI002E1D66E4